MHKASRKRNPNNTEANVAAVESAVDTTTELPHTPLTVDVTAKIIDHPFIYVVFPWQDGATRRGSGGLQG